MKRPSSYTMGKYPFVKRVKAAFRSLSQNLKEEWEGITAKEERREVTISWPQDVIKEKEMGERIDRPLEIHNPHERLVPQQTRRDKMSGQKQAKKIVFVDSLEDECGTSTVRLVNTQDEARQLSPQEPSGVDRRACPQEPERPTLTARKPTPFPNSILQSYPYLPGHPCSPETANETPQNVLPPRRRDFVYPNAIAVKRAAWRYSAAAYEDCNRQRLKDGTSLHGSDFRHLHSPIAITDPVILAKIEEIRARGVKVDEEVEKRKELFRRNGVEILGAGVKRRVEEVRRQSRHLVLESEEEDDLGEEEMPMRERKLRPHSWAPAAEMRREWECVRESFTQSNECSQQRGLHSPTRSRMPIAATSNSPPLPQRQLHPLKEKRSLVLDGEPHWSPPLHVPSPTGLSPPIPPQHTFHQNDDSEPVWYPPTPAPSPSTTSHSSSIPTQFRPSFTPTLPASFMMDISTPPPLSPRKNYAPHKLPDFPPPHPPIPPPDSSTLEAHPSQAPPLPSRPHPPPSGPPQTPLSPKIPPSLSSNIRTPKHLYGPHYAWYDNSVRPTIRLVPKETKSEIGRRGRHAIMSRWTESLLRKKREWSKGVEIVTEEGVAWRAADVVLGNRKYVKPKHVRRVRDRRGGGGMGLEMEGEDEMEVGPPPPPRPDPIPQGYYENIRSDGPTLPNPSLRPDPIPLQYQQRSHPPTNPAFSPNGQKQYNAGPFAEPSEPNSRTAIPTRPTGTAITNASVVSSFSDLMNKEYKLRTPAERGGFAPPHARAKVSAPVREIAPRNGYYTRHQI